MTVMTVKIKKLQKAENGNGPVIFAPVFKLIQGYRIIFQRFIKFKYFPQEFPVQEWGTLITTNVDHENYSLSWTSHFFLP